MAKNIIQANVESDIGIAEKDEKSEFWTQVGQDIDDMIIAHKRADFYEAHKADSHLADLCLCKARKLVGKNPRFYHLEGIDREGEILSLADKLIALEFKKRQAEEEIVRLKRRYYF